MYQSAKFIGLALNKILVVIKGRGSKTKPIMVASGGFFSFQEKKKNHCEWTNFPDCGYRAQNQNRSNDWQALMME